VKPVPGDHSIILNREDTSLYRKGEEDQRRHRERVKEALKNNLAEIVAEESIILADGGKVIKVPIRSLEEFHFKYNINKKQHPGQGRNRKNGDLLGEDNLYAPGRGSGAGDQPGLDYYETEITVDDLAELLFEDLKLPNLQEKKNRDLEAQALRFQDIRRAGVMGNLDKKRTLLQNYRRNALKGRPKIGGITPEDLRFKTWEPEIKEESNAVVVAMMDTSGSMGTFEKYIARSFYFWMVRFLRTKYRRVEIVFIAHHTRAREVTEEEFFTKGESGGTRCSSAYALALEIIKNRYPPAAYNIYPFHFSDGDNLPSDNDNCLKLVKELLANCNAFGYGEIINPYYRGSTLMNVYQHQSEPKMRLITIRDKNEVYKALKAFFSETEI